jgi:ketosteroid isomerase-like protein
MSTRSPSERENVEVAKRIWMAAADGDAKALGEVLSEKVIWRVHGQGRLAGEHRGRDGVIGVFADLGDQVDDLRLSLNDVYANANGAVISYDLWARRGANSIEQEVFVRLRIDDGLVTECDAVPVDQAAMGAFMNWIH